MNRIVVWILGVISGIVLFPGIAMTLASMGAYGASSECSGQSCTPVLHDITVMFPPSQTPFFASGLMLLLLATLIGLPAWIGSPVLAARRNSSARTAILIVSVVASALVVVSIVSPLVTSPALVTPETCLGYSGPGSVCFTGSEAKVVAVLGIGLGPLIASLLVGMPAWVMALTETSRRKQRRWFFAVLVFSPIASMLYGFAGGRRAVGAAPAEAVSPTRDE